MRVQSHRLHSSHKWSESWTPPDCSIPTTSSELDYRDSLDGYAGDRCTAEAMMKRQSIALEQQRAYIERVRGLEAEAARQLREEARSRAGRD